MASKNRGEIVALVAKTAAWGVVSGGLIFLGAVQKCPVEAALLGTLAAVGLKTPVYMAFEPVWNRLWYGRGGKPGKVACTCGKCECQPVA
jgi:hypothetical protein